MPCVRASHKICLFYCDDFNCIGQLSVLDTIVVWIEMDRDMPSENFLESFQKFTKRSKLVNILQNNRFR